MLVVAGGRLGHGGWILGYLFGDAHGRFFFGGVDGHGACGLIECVVGR